MGLNQLGHLLDALTLVCGLSWGHLITCLWVHCLEINGSHKFSMDTSSLGPGMQCRDTKLVNTWGSEATWCGTRTCLVTARPCFHNAVCRTGYLSPSDWQHICLESNWSQTTQLQRELAATDVPGQDKSSWTIRWHLEKKTLCLL